MKKSSSLFLLSGAVFVLLTISACSSSRVANDSSLWTKRKYRPGLHFNGIQRKTQAATKEKDDSRPFTSDDSYSSVGLRFAPVSAIISAATTPINPDSLAFSEDEKESSAIQVDARVEELGRRKREKANGSTENPTEPTEKKKKERFYDPVTLGIISISAGGANMIFMFIPILGVLIGVLGFVFGLKSAQSEKTTAVLLGALGMIFSIFTLAFAIFWTILIISSIAVSSNQF